MSQEPFVVGTEKKCFGYRLKVSEKRGEGEWRRIYVPEGLTFSALSLVLGCCWSGADREPQAGDFSFVFVRRQLYFAEAPGRGGGAPAGYAQLDAAVNGIDPYIAQVRRFVWCCGQGKEYREYQIVVEGRISYAAGAKMLGCTRKISPKGKYTGERMERMFQRLVWLRYTLPQQEDLPTLAQMVHRLDDGEGGIPLQREPRSDVALVSAGREEEPLRDVFGSVGRVEEPQREPRQEPESRSLARELAGAMQKRRLVRLADELGVRDQVRGEMRKDQIAELCVRALLEPERLRSTMVLLYSPLGAYELILKVARQMGRAYVPQDEREEKLMGEIGGLYFWLKVRGSEGIRYLIPADAAEAILALDTPEYRRWRADRRRVADCAALVPSIYGVISLHAFGRICRRDPDFSCRDEEVREILDELQTLDPPRGRDVLCQDRLVVYSVLQEQMPGEAAWLAGRIQGMRFYVPTQEEIGEIYRKMCLDSPQQERLERFLKEEIPALSAMKRERELDELRWNISLDDQSRLHQMCAELAEKHSLSDERESELEDLVVDLYNHSHIFMYQGFTPLQKDRQIRRLSETEPESRF